MKKLALVLDGVGIGGIEKVASSYVKIFRTLGYDVTVINLNPKKQEMLESFPNNIAFINFGLSRKESPEQYAQLVKHGWWGKFVYPILYIVLSLWITIKKIAFKIKYRNPNFDLVISFASHFNDLTFVSRNYVRARKKMSWSHGAIYSYALISDGYLNLYNRIKNIVVLVDDAQQELLTYNKNLKLNVHKIYNPVYFDATQSTSRETEIESKFGTFLLMVARFSYPHKDHYTVIKAFKEVVKQHPDVDLVLVGDGPELDKVKQFAESLGEDVSRKIHFIGATKDVTSYYRSAKILLHASVAGEGLPTVILEALSNGLPVISTDSKVGPREILGNDEYGLLSKVQNSVDMASKINLLLENEDLYLKYCNLGKMRIKEFTPDKITEKLNYALKSLVE